MTTKVADMGSRTPSLPFLFGKNGKQAFTNGNGPHWWMCLGLPVRVGYLSDSIVLMCVDQDPEEFRVQSLDITMGTYGPSPLAYQPHSAHGALVL